MSILKRDLKSIYCGEETWETVIPKIDDWLVEFITFLGIDRLDPQDSLEKNFFIIHGQNGLVLECSYLTSPWHIGITADSGSPGHLVVSYWSQDRVNEEGIFPLTGLSGFADLLAAQNWLVHNPEFYKWDQLMERVT